MNESKEAITPLSFASTFVGLLVFSTLATEVFLGYLLVRGQSISDMEAIFAGLLVWLFFSVVGQRFVRIRDSGRWILFISAITSAAYYRFFNIQEVLGFYVVYDLFIFVSMATVFGTFVWWGLNSALKNLPSRKISKKSVLMFVAVSSATILSIYAFYGHQQTITSFFDSHPWAVSLIGIIVSIVMGVFIGRRTKD